METYFFFPCGCMQFAVIFQHFQRRGEASKAGIIIELYFTEKKKRESCFWCSMKGNHATPPFLLFVSRSQKKLGVCLSPMDMGGVVGFIFFGGGRGMERYLHLCIWLDGRKMVVTSAYLNLKKHSKFSGKWRQTQHEKRNLNFVPKLCK